MALRNIVCEGEPVLRKVCREVDDVNDRIRMILDDFFCIFLILIIVIIIGMTKIK